MADARKLRDAKYFYFSHPPNPEQNTGPPVCCLFPPTFCPLSLLSKQPASSQAHIPYICWHCHTSLHLRRIPVSVKLGQKNPNSSKLKIVCIAHSWANSSNISNHNFQTKQTKNWTLKSPIIITAQASCRCSRSQWKRRCIKMTDVK